MKNLIDKRIAVLRPDFDEQNKYDFNDESSAEFSDNSDKDGY